jgi:penicillin-insensitive murein endopeptidase
MSRLHKALVWTAGAILVTTGGVVTYCHGGSNEPSTCYGTPGAGALHGGWRLPKSGPNFETYSLTGWALGRTYVHSAVHAVVLDAYAELQRALPGRPFMYGETGLIRGGGFRPHRTHQNGLSVDFMVPVLNATGKPTTLPTSPTNEFGYAIDFDRSGRKQNLTIDFEAVALHLAELRAAARKHDVAISRVIFAPDLQPHLKRTKAWSQISNLPFSKRPSWVRHDDHYHVDFRVPCKAFSQAP